MIEDINKIMDDIEYGFKDDNGYNIINNQERWDNEFDDFYYLQEPLELLKSKCGVCWDQVELERKLFSDIGIDAVSYFIYLNGNDMLPSHTFLVYELNSKYYWFEHSWNKYKGIHEYSNLDNLLSDVIDKFKKDHLEVNDGILYLYKYIKPIKHIKCMDFYNYINTQELVYKEII